MLSVNISDIAIITIRNVDYHYIIHNIEKSEAINILENALFSYAMLVIWILLSP